MPYCERQCRRFDANKALDACVATARHRNYEGIGDYMDNGYIPDEKNGNSVSSTQNMLMMTGAIAQLAKKLNRMDIYRGVYKRSQNYKNVYDPKVGFMHPKLADGTFRKKFDPLLPLGRALLRETPGIIRCCAPHDPAGLIN
jgi:putative alpha-1,2-mannosidase